MSPPHDMSHDERRELLAQLGGEYKSGDGAASAPAADLASKRAELEALVKEEHAARLRDDEALRQRVRDAERERDEARAEVALAYPRALQAAASEVQALLDDENETDGLDMEAILLTAKDCILALTPDDIDRITKEHEHG